MFKVYKKFLLFLAITVFLCMSASIVWSESKVDFVEIKLLDNLDDKRGFCIDIKGYKLKAKINKGLQAHTCYSYQGEIAVDQGLDANRFKYKKLFFPNFNVCVSSTSSKKTLSLNLIKCINAQKFVIGEDNTIRLKNNINLCLTVAKGNSRKGGGGLPAHLIRNLTMQTCNHQISIYQTWGIRGFKKGKIFTKKISKSL
tara:strand:- start:95 stop:691 length:597 start_codon:yes stop_codon:yes gene_type:complete